MARLSTVHSPEVHLKKIADISAESANFRLELRVPAIMQAIASRATRVEAGSWL